MDPNWLQGFSNTWHSIALTVAVINGILHIIFAGAIARDSGQLSKVGRNTYLVSGVTWAFATLVGGVFVAAVYWFMHYSTLSRVTGGYKEVV